MGHFRRKRPTGGASLVRQRRADRSRQTRRHAIHFQPPNPGCDGLLSTSLLRTEASHHSEGLRFAARPLRPTRTRPARARWVELSSNRSQNGSSPAGTTHWWGIACTTAPGLPLAADSQSCHTFPACKPGGDGLLSTSLKRLEAFHRSEVLRFAARRIRPMRTRRTPQQWVNLRSNPSQHGSFPPGTTRGWGIARTTPPGATLDQTSILSLRFPAHKPRRRGGFRAHDDPTESGKVLGTAPVRHWPPPTRAGATGDPKVGPTAAAGVEKWVLPSDRGPLMGHTAG